MSLRTYCRETLTGNWFEERQAGLNGVLPRGRAAGYETTSAAAFAPPAQRKAPAGRAGGRVLDAKTIKRQILAGSRWAPTDADESDEVRAARAASLHNAHFGPRVRETRVQRMLADGVQHAPPAGGHPSRGQANLLKKEHGSGMVGECFQASDDPKADTAAQRAWLPGAPELRRYGNTAPPDASYMSLPLEDRRYDVNAIKSTSVYEPRRVTIGLTAPSPVVNRRVDRLQVFQDCLE